MTEIPRFDPENASYRAFAQAAWDEASTVDRIFTLACHIEAFGDVPIDVWRALPICTFADLPPKVQSGITSFLFVARRMVQAARAGKSGKGRDG